MRREIDQPRAAAAVREFLAAIGADPDSPELARTPARVADLAGELFAGIGVDAAGILREGRLPDAAGGGLVVVRDIAFRAVCEHHLLPMSGHIHLAYLPDEAIVGLGRLYDLVEVCSSRLTLQETLAQDLVDALMAGVGARGALAVVEASQGCVTMRGPRQSGSDSVSIAAAGSLEEGPLRAEAFHAIALAARERDTEPGAEA